MDAKLGDLVITPRRGKAVEINALFYNALRLLEGWLREERAGAGADRIAAAADRARAAFNQRFWSEERGYLLDIVDGERGDDDAFRPNQIFAVALAHPVLDRARWARVIDEVDRRLVTPGGLRTLLKGHPDYQPRYFGDLRARDMAYHQGTAWAWLAGPFIDAWLKVHPGDLAPARTLLGGLFAHIDVACVGSISEVFDAEQPFTPRGCFAQAWSVAEVLRRRCSSLGGKKRRRARLRARRRREGNFNAKAQGRKGAKREEKKSDLCAFALISGSSDRDKDFASRSL